MRLWTRCDSNKRKRSLAVVGIPPRILLVARSCAIGYHPTSTLIQASLTSPCPVPIKPGPGMGAIGGSPHPRPRLGLASLLALQGCLQSLAFFPAVPSPGRETMIVAPGDRPVTRLSYYVSAPITACTALSVRGRSSALARPPLLFMGRDWVTDQIEWEEEELENVHAFVENRGKNLVRGPATVPGPDGPVEVRAGELVEIINGVVFRTFLGDEPMIDNARLKLENKVMLEIVWGDDWDTNGFTIEVFGMTGPECVEYTQRFCEATGCVINGPVVCKPAYYEVPVMATQNQGVLEKLKSIQAGTTTLDLSSRGKSS
jgi:hypothetical protein